MLGPKRNNNLRRAELFLHVGVLKSSNLNISHNNIKKLYFSTRTLNPSLIQSLQDRPQQKTEEIVFSSSLYKIIDSRDIIIWRRLNCFKHRQNQKRPLFQREEDGLFTFHFMARGKLKAK